MKFPELIWSPWSSFSLATITSHASSVEAASLSGRAAPVEAWPMDPHLQMSPKMNQQRNETQVAQPVSPPRIPGTIGWFLHKQAKIAKTGPAMIGPMQDQNPHANQVVKTRWTFNGWPSGMTMLEARALAVAPALVTEVWVNPSTHQQSAGSGLEYA